MPGILASQGNGKEFVAVTPARRRNAQMVGIVRSLDFFKEESELFEVVLIPGIGAAQGEGQPARTLGLPPPIRTVLASGLSCMLG